MTNSEYPQEDKLKQDAYLNSDVEILRELWIATPQENERIEILKELERRNASEALIFCFELAGWHYPSSKDRNRHKDRLFIVQAFGRLQESKAVSLLSDLLNDKDYVMRTQALESLGAIKEPKSVEYILPLLFDSNPGIRGKAVHTLGEIGDARAVGRISMLLADKDEFVRNLAETNLRKLGATEEQIQEWKSKAEGLSLDDLYTAKLSYEKAVREKEVLQAKLENETDVKRHLEKSLKEHELALKRKEEIVESLYENERQLQSKLAQLNIAQQQSEAYQEQLRQLNAKIQSLTKDLEESETQTANANVKEKLDRALLTQATLEQAAKVSQEKESVLRDEIANLSALAEDTRIEAQKVKAELVVMRSRETELVAQVEDLKKRLNRVMAPVVVISKPENGSTVKVSVAMLNVIAVDDKGIRSIELTSNNQPLPFEVERGFKIDGSAEKEENKKVTITARLHLNYGSNTIRVKAVDMEGISTLEEITVMREKEHGDIWAVVIGINRYMHSRDLKYALNDALAFKKYLQEYIGIADDHIFTLINEEATKTRIENQLGTQLKRRAAKEDTVIIFYAGHGAVETDPSNPDGDGFEKYLLPHDADLNDLYTTSISMDDVAKIFQRIRAERLIFIADTCYSGASGGRTQLATKTRANLSDKFFERVSKGKGRVIISSCSANEVSKEDDNLQHGIFSYYLLRGLEGQADQDRDSIVTVSELFSFLSRKVPEASGQDQHPVKKGETEGELVIGRVK